MYSKILAYARKGSGFMGYVYDVVKKAIGDKSNNRWSPNNIRAIYLTQRGILIGYFINNPKFVPFDPSEVQKDMQLPNRGSINSLLENRQLSCLEEIYVDQLFANWRNLIDLEAYCRGMFNQSSRLRYYGVIGNVSMQNLVEAYQRILIEGSLDFTFAKNIGVCNAVDLNNADWYKKHNLRPQYYALDAEKGKLATYFKKCETTIVTAAEAQESRNRIMSEAALLQKAVSVDLGNYSAITYLVSFINFSKNGDALTKACGTLLQKNLLNPRKVIKGFSKKKVSAVFREANPRLQSLLALYSKLGVFDSDDSVGILSPDLEMTGILDFYKTLDMCTAELINSLRSNIDKESLRILLLECGGLPDGKASQIAADKLEERAIPNKGAPNDRGIERFTHVLYGLCGMTEPDFINYIKSRKE